ncbi:NAD(P)-binding protein, partial [Rhizoclosmatium globosum]
DRVTYIQCDVSSYKSVEAASHKVFQDVGVPTVLVNNAGILGGRKFCDMDPEVIEKVVNVNLLGPMWTTRLFLPRMMENNHGHILNVVSLLGISGSTGVAEYCASKFGLSGFTEAMIQETKHTNVRVSAIYPGLISTALFTGVRYRFNLFPTLSPDYVAEKMVKILEAGKSAEVVIPTIANLGRAMKLIPVGVQSVVKDVSGFFSCLFIG